MNQLRLSLVIPAYNEERHLRQCLQSVAKQIVRPYEVIVVDNNSSDATARIAAEFSFVKVIHEPRQGVVYARDAGFMAARGEIIGRIDADTLLPANWTQKALQIFQADPELDAVSGRVHYYDVALAPLGDSIDYFLRRRLARLLQETNSVFLQGANMALRRSAWLHVQKVLCRQDGMHEDFDLAIHLQEFGHAVRFDENLIAALSSRRTDVSFLQFMHYVRMSPHTYALHSIASRRHMYPVAALTLMVYVPARILYRGFDPDTGSFSLTKACMPSGVEKRVDPTVAS